MWDGLLVPGQWTRMPIILRLVIAESHVMRLGFAKVCRAAAICQRPPAIPCAGPVRGVSLSVPIPFPAERQRRSCYRLLLEMSEAAQGP